ncbi:hypothetical protein BJ170DRAFT_680291 [Xylariales sp. AK1849]|nr:hypothetical protein BJ170DRAFT_680291 [Xylariales sp. AK1849]
MMQNHMAASAPREVLNPVDLAMNSVHDKHIVAESCGATADDLDEDLAIPALNITDKAIQSGTGRLISITIALPASGGSHYIDWIGLWGGVKYSDVTADGKTSVPEGLTGHVWIVVNSVHGMKAKEIEKSALSGMEKVWMTDSWAHT